jgi:hypothetical protein
MKNPRRSPREHRSAAAGEIKILLHGREGSSRNKSRMAGHIRRELLMRKEMQDEPEKGK